MINIRTIVLCMLLAFTCVSSLLSQGESAVPFLLISSSPEGNGMAGIAGSILTDNAMSPNANPGQLGLLSLDYYFVGSIYTPKSDWLPPFQQNNLTYDSRAVNVGFNPGKLLALPIGLSYGMSYSRIDLNLGTFNITDPNGPGVIGTFDAKESSENHTFGLGLDYIVKIGIGYTIKDIVSEIAPFNVQGQGRRGVARFSTEDFGVIAHLPIFGVISKLNALPVTVFPNIEPLFDITFGYARKNLGDKLVVYIDPAQGDPLPRTALLGLSWKAGFVSHANAHDWEIVSFTFAREAEDLLVTRTPAPTDSLGNVIGNPPPPQYQGGMGDIEFSKNVLFGEWNGKVFLRKGWQISIGEALILRGGSMTAPGLAYSSDGFGLRLGGVLKMLEAASPGALSSPVFGFLLNHVDIRFDHSSESSGTSPRNGTSYNGLNLVLK